ncbi:MAG: hypothetical protein L0Z07_10015 [Planctomycetes bacterium]|nr:hypothetical protein [Planctomycetota bacterium]
MDSFNDILRRARKELTPNEQIKLIDELSRCSSGSTDWRSIRELRGLGKETWEAIDADEYVRKEREMEVLRLRDVTMEK